MSLPSQSLWRTVEGVAVPVSVPPGLGLRFQLWHDLIQKYDEISGLTVGDDNGEVMIYAFMETHTHSERETLRD